MKSIFTDEQNTFLKQNYDKMPYKEIADILGFTERQVRGRINNMGLVKLRKFNKQYFNNIGSPNQAYWLGFIYADGYVIHNKTIRNYELGIELQRQDEYMLHRLSQELGGVHPVIQKHDIKTINKNMCESDLSVLRIYSKEIVEGLIKQNVVCNKTYCNEFPKSQDFFWHLLRGFNDGDGCLHISSQRNAMYVQLTNANKSFF